MGEVRVLRKNELQPLVSPAYNPNINNADGTLDALAKTQQ
jgi:hypothetical protein